MSLAEQRAREEKDRQWWLELKRLAEANDIRGWYARYAAYLEWAGVHSGNRKMIHKMAKLVAENEQ